MLLAGMWASGAKIQNEPYTAQDPTRDPIGVTLVASGSGDVPRAKTPVTLPRYRSVGCWAGVVGGYC